MLRLVEELLYSLRREGFTLSTAQAIDAVRTVELVGWDDRALLRTALASVIVENAGDRARFIAGFDRFFSAEGPHPGDLYARLAARGFDAREIAVVRELITRMRERTSSANAAIRAVMGSPSELDHLLAVAGVARDLERLSSPSQVGYFHERAASALGVGVATSALAAVGRALQDALGERGIALAAALQAELGEMKRRLRAHVEDRARAVPIHLDRAGSFAALSPGEARDMRRAVRRIADKLRGKEQVRRKRARRGRIDAAHTLRRAFATGGVPFALVRKGPRRDRPKLVVVCDVSESVRTASSFMLEFVAVVSDLFDGVRSFVFVSELAETTALFSSETPGRALQAIAGGGVISLSATSSYGRALAQLEAKTRHTIDKKTTIAILGDGRSNHKADGAEILADLRRRARAVLWICPEPRSSWGVGDSRMPTYERVCSAVLEARTVRDLERAARELLHLR